MIKATIIRDLDRQSQRQANGSVTGPYLEQGTPILIADAVYKNGTTLWYKLNNNLLVKNTEVDLEAYSGLSDPDRKHFYICYRSIDENQQPREDMAPAPEMLFFGQMPLPEDQGPFRVNNWSSQLFTNVVMESIGELDDESRKHVFIYIHGFDWEPGLKLDLHEKFIQSYFTHSENSIAKVLYFGWPSYGWRRKADDRAVDDGRDFTGKGFFNHLILLSKTLQEKGMTLNLIVHSFGHQLLNGMINPLPANLPVSGKIFRNIFLMAPDVTYLSVQRGGVKLRNQVGSIDYEYNLKPLKDLADHVHIFSDPFDYLLYISTKKFSGGADTSNFDPLPDQAGITTDYRGLGSYGEKIFHDLNLDLEEGFSFHDVQKIINGADPGSPLYYPFLNLARPANDQEVNAIDAARRVPNADYDKFKIIPTGLKREFFQTHHQYLFTSRPVVDHVLKLLNQVQIDLQPDVDENIPV